MVVKAATADSRAILLGGADVAITEDDGSLAESSTLGLRWQHLTGPYSDTLTHVVVDPKGVQSTITSTVANGSSGGAYGITTFGFIREIPGVWTYYVYDSTGLLTTLQINVTTSLPVVNDAPVAVFSFTENPVTRAAALTTNVTGDTEGNSATIVWHLPGTGTVSVPLGGPSGSNVQNITLSGTSDWEVFAEVNDDAARYTADPGNNVGGAGSGFQRLYRYASSGRNHGPDYDGDNSSDILWRNISSGQNWFYGMKGNLLQVSAGINTVTDTNWEIAGNGDYNGDGKSDILWRNSSTGQLWIYVMDGSTISSSIGINMSGKTVPDINTNVVGSGDYDGDGLSDILWRNNSTGFNWIYFMDSATITNALGINIVSGTAWQVVGNGDYNGDGMSDILWRNSDTGQNWMYLMSGATIDSSVGVNSVSDTFWKIVGSGDYNGDGNADILWRNSDTGQNWMYLMSGATIDSSVGVNTVPTAWQVAGGGDYNGDGKADILWRNDSTGQNWVNLMSGATIIASAGINNVAAPNWQIVNNN